MMLTNNRSFAILLLAIIAASGLVADKGKAETLTGNTTYLPYSFSHATYYVVNNSLIATTLDHDNFKPFDFVYLSSLTNWVASDFVGSEDPKAAFKIFATKQAWPSGNSGRSLAPVIISMIHKAGGKAILTVGGRDSEFFPIVNDRVGRANFVYALSNFARSNNFDGIDIDWEGDLLDHNHPLYLDFMAELRIALKKAYMGSTPLLTTAQEPYAIFPSVDIAKLVQSVDRVNLMTYDMGGGTFGKILGHNAPMNLISVDVQRWLDNGFPANKLHLGLMNYGYVYRGIKPGVNYPQGLQEAGHASDLVYDGFMRDYFPTWKEKYDSTAMMSYFFSQNSQDVISIETDKTVAHKLDFALEKHLGGVFWWVFHGDRRLNSEDGANNKNLLIDSVVPKIELIRARYNHKLTAKPE